GSDQFMSAATATTRDSAAVPKKVPRNSGFSTETLTDCMAETPDAGEMRPSAAMTHAEKARKKPAMRPEPSAARNVKANIKDPIRFPRSRCSPRLDRRLGSTHLDVFPEAEAVRHMAH